MGACLAKLVESPSELVFAACENGALKTWSVSNPGECLGTVKVFSGSLLATQVSLDARHGVVTDESGNIVLFDAVEGTVLKRTRIHGGADAGVTIDETGRYAALGTSEGIVHLWDMHENTIRSFSAHTRATADTEMTSLVMTPNGSRILCGYTNGTVTGWNPLWSEHASTPGGYQHM